MTTLTAHPDALADPRTHAAGDAPAIWRWMREHAPVHWHEPGHLPGFWSLTRYDDVRAAYRDPRTFSSRHGVLLRPAELGQDPGGGMTLALTDPPRHKQLRAVVADWFTARSVRGLEEAMRRAVKDVLARALERGECDVVHDIAGRLSISVIGHLMGVPEEDHEALFRWTNEAFAAHISLAAHQELMRYFIALMDRRMTDPGDDLVSMLIGGTIDDRLLTEEEILLNCENLVGATENGRLALAGGVLALLRYPGQWAKLVADPGLLPTAVEEILRWTSSATHSMRTATAPVELGGHRIEAGDRVVLWVPSANRDETVFAHPDRFDVARKPNRHLAFGGGEHFCLGAVLARAQMRILFGEFLGTVAEFELTGPVRPVASINVGGPETLPIRLTGK
ncbi:cytochrome P450 [Amycolatopsis sp. NPDC004625]|uniref:cytochrome P450 n=1 Tax=Amycolatopsis sp. NPDC004625 TaxID=3154670 RepID=UPI0033A7E565